MLFDLLRWLRCDWKIQPGQHVPEDFFGINVATGPDPEADERVLALVRELGIRQLRIDLDAAGLDGHPARLLDRLRDAGYHIWLRLLQPIDATGDTADWRRFLQAVHERYADVATIEIGTTTNRRRWSGYTYASYAAAWRVAAKILDRPLAGPNISDFEPTHARLLIARLHPRPAIQSVNLFTERTKIPEAFDHRVAGQWLAPRLKLNLTKKSRVFTAISQRFGIAETVCTHTCWNGERIARWSDDMEGRRSDYLKRYLLLAAAAGDLRRVYWGPLIGYADGLVDDGTGAAAEGERVARYLTVPGDPAQWTPRPALSLLAELQQTLAGATCTEAHLGETCRLAFEKDGKTHVFEWQAIP